VSILRPPKVFQSHRDKEQFILPRFVKISIWLIILLSGLVYFLFFSPVFQIKNIEIVGSPSDEVKVFLEKIKGKNIFSFSSARIEQDIIAKNQNYLSVKVDRGIPDTTRVIFQDREAKIVWQTQNKKYFVDKEAIVFREVSDSSELPLVSDLKNLNIQIPTQIATAKFIDFVKDASTELKNANIIVRQFQVNETTFQLEAVTEQGIRIIFDTLRPLSEQISAFHNVYNKDKDKIKVYVDLRVEGWVYYK